MFRWLTTPTSRLQRENAFQYQPLSDPTNQSLHASLPPDKQAELAEKMLLQQIEQNRKRFEQEMQKEDHKVKRSRMLVMTGVKIFKWLFIVLVAAFAGLVIVLGVTGWKAGSLSGHFHHQCIGQLLRLDSFCLGHEL